MEKSKSKLSILLCALFLSFLVSLEATILLMDAKNTFQICFVIFTYLLMAFLPLLACSMEWSDET
jgi:uncharacterized membrane protein